MLGPSDEVSGGEECALRSVDGSVGGFMDRYSTLMATPMSIATFVAITISDNGCHGHRMWGGREKKANFVG